MVARKYSCSLSCALPLSEAVREVLAPYRDTPGLLRTLFIGEGSGNDNYFEELAIIKQVTRQMLGYTPAVSYIIQKPIGSRLALEVTSLQSDASLRYEDNYVVVDEQELILGAVVPSDLYAPACVQSDEVLGRVGQILTLEGFTIADIARQWNYIERITDVEQGAQRYQDFNDSRSRFYGETLWSGGYPAATGIGTRGAGIAVELDAYKCDAYSHSTALDNPLQIAAHNYSNDVLVKGVAEGRSTPKFERGRVVAGSQAGVIYVSGTAAIRGQQSCQGCDAQMQTRLTMENIDYLVGSKNMKLHGIEYNGTARYAVLRVYIKDESDAPAVCRYLAEHYPDAGVVPLWADICRKELLVEIETTITII